MPTPPPKQTPTPTPQEQQDPIERGIFRISRMTEAAGFNPLTVQDIEQILSKVEPPRAMPGVRQPPETTLGEAPLPNPENFSFQHGMDRSGTTPSLGGLVNPMLRTNQPRSLLEQI